MYPSLATSKIGHVFPHIYPYTHHIHMSSSIDNTERKRHSYKYNLTLFPFTSREMMITHLTTAEKGQRVVEPIRTEDLKELCL